MNGAVVHRDGGVFSFVLGSHLKARPMIGWLVAILRERPEIAFFVTITLGYALGRLRIGSFTLGAVTGVLLAGVLVGQLGIVLPGALKQVFFGCSILLSAIARGPSSSGLKQDGLAQAALAAVFAFVALGVVYVVARVLGYEAGTAAGLLAGDLNRQRSERLAMPSIILRSPRRFRTILRTRFLSPSP